MAGEGKSKSIRGGGWSKCFGRDRSLGAARVWAWKSGRRHQEKRQLDGRVQVPWERVR